MTGHLHSLSCDNNPCACMVLHPVRARDLVVVSPTWDNEEDGGLSISHAIMRGGPHVRLSPGVGTNRVSRRLRP